MRIIINEDLLKKEVKEKKIKRAFVQLPEGLRKEIPKLNELLNSLGVEGIFDLESCFGSCDLPFERARIYGCDSIIHIGHLPIKKVKRKEIKTIFIPAYLDFEKNKIIAFLEKNREIFKNLSKCVFIGYSLPYKKVFDLVCNFICKENEDVEIKTGKNALTGEDGLILGCDFSALKESTKENDVFLVTGGVFHALGAVDTLKFRRILNLDVDALKINIFGKDEKIKREKIKLAKYAKFLESEKIGLLICDKIGQWQSDFETVKNNVEKMGKQVCIISCFTAKKEKILGLDVDIILNLACPRIEEDDFEKPIISWKTLKYFLEKYRNR